MSSTNDEWCTEDGWLVMRSRGPSVACRCSKVVSISTSNHLVFVTAEGLGAVHLHYPSSEDAARASEAIRTAIVEADAR